jgi:hypothetical protein
MELHTNRESNNTSSAPLRALNRCPETMIIEEMQSYYGQRASVYDYPVSIPEPDFPMRMGTTFRCGHCLMDRHSE